VPAYVGQQTRLFFLLLSLGVMLSLSTGGGLCDDISLHVDCLALLASASRVPVFVVNPVSACVVLLGQDVRYSLRVLVSTDCAAFPHACPKIKGMFCDLYHFVVCG